MLIWLNPTELSGKHYSAEFKNQQTRKSSVNPQVADHTFIFHQQAENVMLRNNVKLLLLSSQHSLSEFKTRNIFEPMTEIRPPREENTSLFG